jgi:hypothetical protein
MTNEEAINELKEASDSEVRYGDIKHHHDEVMKRVVAFDMAIEALEQQPCEDCISREAVDEYITNLLSGYLYDEERTRLEDLTTFIWELPSVQPTRPTGKWETFVEDYNKCSKCGEMGKFYRIYKYCPNCGAKMGESENEE